MLAEGVAAAREGQPSLARVWGGSTVLFSCPQRDESPFLCEGGAGDTDFENELQG